MAKKMYEEANIAAIAQKIRDKAETETTYTTAEMPNGVDEVYEKGYEKGKSEGGSNKLPQVLNKTVTELTAADFEGATDISMYLFENCTQLTKAELSDTITVIKQYAFRYCSNLISVIIGSGVTAIWDSVFRYCGKLKSIYYNGDIASWCNIGYADVYSNPLCNSANLYIKNSLGEYELVTDVAIPDTVTEIKSYKFSKCTSITSVTMPDSVTSIGSSAFSSCNGLTNVRIGNGITSIGSNAFSSCSKLSDIYIDAPEDSISGAPWGAPNSPTIHWNTPLPTEEE